MKTIKPTKSLIEFLKTHNMELLSPYTGSRATLEWRCPENHIFPAKWHSVQSAGGCLTCRDKRKLTYEQVKANLEALNTTLVTPKEKYENSYKQDLDLICDKGHF